MFQVWWPAGLAALIAASLMPLVISSRWLGYDDDFNGVQKTHDVSTSRLGGFSIFITYVAVLIVAVKTGHSALSPALGLLLCSLPVVAVGMWEDITRRVHPWHRLAGAVASAVLASSFANGVIARLDSPFVDDWLQYIPFVLPVLPLRTFVAYQESLGRSFALRFHVDRNAGNDVPIEHYADMTGWPELAATVDRVYRALPAAERAQAAILTRNAGEAAAIEIYGERYGLPPVLSGNNNYWLWGTRGVTGNILIDVNANVLDDRLRFASVILAATFRNPYAMPYENDVRIYLCRGIHRPLAMLWPKLRDYSYGFEGL